MADARKGWGPQHPATLEAEAVAARLKHAKPDGAAAGAAELRTVERGGSDGPWAIPGGAATSSPPKVARAKGCSMGCVRIPEANGGCHEGRVPGGGLLRYLVLPSDCLLSPPTFTVTFTVTQQSSL